MSFLKWRPLLPHAGFIVVYILWGINVTSMKIGGAEWDPLVFNGMRFLSMAPLLGAYTYLYYRSGRLQRTDRRLSGQMGNSSKPSTAAAAASPATAGTVNWRLTRKDLLLVVLLGLLTASHETVLSYAVQFSSTANASVLGRGFMPIVTAIIALYLRQMKLSWRISIGVPVAFLGAILMVAGNGLHFGLDTLRGDVMLVTRSGMGACYLIVMSRLVGRYPVLLVTTLEIAFAAVWLLPFVIWRVDADYLLQMSAQGWISLVYTGTMATVVGFMLHNWSLGKLGPFKSSAYGFTLPLFAGLAGYVLLKETVTTVQVVGGIVVMVAMYLVQRDRMEQTTIDVQAASLPKSTAKADI